VAIGQKLYTMTRPGAVYCSRISDAVIESVNVELRFRHLFRLGTVVRFEVHYGSLPRVDAPDQVYPSADVHPVPEIDLDRLFGELDLVEQVLVVPQVVGNDASRRLLRFIAKRRLRIRGMQMRVDETSHFIHLG